VPRPSRPWFRFYTEALHDPKLCRMPAVHRWVWVAVLAAARQSCVPGVLLVSEHQPMDEKDLAHLASVPRREVRKALSAMEAAGMVTLDETIDAWCVTKWADRQFESDKVTERTRKSRSNDDDRNSQTAFPGTPPETETDTDTENPPNPPVKRGGQNRRRQREPPTSPLNGQQAAALAHAQTNTDRIHQIGAEPVDPETNVTAIRQVRANLRNPSGPPRQT
jgi:hypothetical protein